MIYKILENNQGNKSLALEPESIIEASNLLMNMKQDEDHLLLPIKNKGVRMKVNVRALIEKLDKHDLQGALSVKQIIEISDLIICCIQDNIKGSC